MHTTLYTLTGDAARYCASVALCARPSFACRRTRPTRRRLSAFAPLEGGLARARRARDSACIATLAFLKQSSTAVAATDTSRRTAGRLARSAPIAAASTRSSPPSAWLPPPHAVRISSAHRPVAPTLASTKAPPPPLPPPSLLRSTTRLAALGGRLISPPASPPPPRPHGAESG